MQSDHDQAEEDGISGPPFVMPDQTGGATGLTKAALCITIAVLAVGSAQLVRGAPAAAAATYFTSFYNCTSSCRTGDNDKVAVVSSVSGGTQTVCFTPVAGTRITGAQVFLNDPAETAVDSTSLRGATGRTCLSHTTIAGSLIDHGSLRSEDSAVATTSLSPAAGCTDTYTVSVAPNGDVTGATLKIGVFIVEQHTALDGTKVGYQLQWGDNTPAQTLVFSGASGLDSGPNGDVPWSGTGTRNGSHTAVYGNALKTAQICAHEAATATTTTAPSTTAIPATTTSTATPVAAAPGSTASATTTTAPLRTPQASGAQLPNTGGSLIAYWLGLVALSLLLGMLLMFITPRRRFHRLTQWVGERLGQA